MFNELSPYFWVGFYAVGMYVGALNSKALAATIAYCIGLSIAYPTTGMGVFLLLLYIPSVLLAQFRD